MHQHLPADVARVVESLELIIAKWPVHIPIDTVVSWLLQFDPAHYELAARLVRSTGVLGTPQVRGALRVAHSRLLRRSIEKGTLVDEENTVFVATGSASKSGGLIAYLYRLETGMSDQNFATGGDEELFRLDQVKNVVLVDDVIGTGKTVIKAIREFVEDVYAVSDARGIYVLAAAGYREGIEAVERETGASAICGYEYSSVDCVRSLDCSIYSGLPQDQREEFRSALIRYNRIASQLDFGFGNVGGLVVFENNTPNTTVPVLWASGNGWVPLFPRAKIVPGLRSLVNAVKSKADEVEKAPREQGTPLPRDGKTLGDLTILVEGKFDEFFFDFLIQERDLAKRLDVASVRSVALGGLYQSDRLMKMLVNAGREIVMILDGDGHSRRLVENNPAFLDLPVVFNSPNFVALLDVKQIVGDRAGVDGDHQLSDFGPGTDGDYMELEKLLFKRGPFSAAPARVFDVCRRYLDDAKYGELVDKIQAERARHSIKCPPAPVATPG